ncbi:ATP-binding protein [Algoriphagus jejuensis]|uniref:histidine kinase n=2 Tax=Algoriphagus jejuensis TaxID=419934 RepID=A0ABP3YK95_9BACT
MPLDHLHFILEGSIDSFLIQEEQKKIIFQYQQGGILGFFPYSDNLKSVSYCQAASSLKLASYPKSKIQVLISQNPDLTKALVKILVSRTNNFTTHTLQNEKMIALGKLSAGLSHELNNPIAAIQRDTSELGRLFVGDELLDLLLGGTGLDDAQQAALHQAMNQWKKLSRPHGMKPSEIIALEKDWLEKLTSWGMKNPVEAAEVFTDSGISAEEVGYWVEKIPFEKADSWLSGIQFFLQSQALVSTIKRATERINNLIGAVKTFTHSNQESTRTPLDLSKGIENTLIILGHKLKVAKVEIAFSKPDLPVIIAGYPSELNQVWTNLIDNAIDAVAGIISPRLEIRIVPENDKVYVSISDNGAGIPAEVKARIFDPFFTTKGIGKGSGMGLDLVNQIMLKHGGKIQADSEPGNTTFLLEFPKN